VTRARVRISPGTPAFAGSAVLDPPGVDEPWYCIRTTIRIPRERAEDRLSHRIILPHIDPVQRERVYMHIEPERADV